MGMLANGARVHHADSNREGIIQSKRRVPRSHPVAWEYLVKFEDEAVWLKRYSVKPVDTRGPRLRGTPHK